MSGNRGNNSYLERGGCCAINETHHKANGLPNASAEVAMNVLAYNFKRLLAILGFQEMMKVMRLARLTVTPSHCPCGTAR